MAADRLPLRNSPVPVKGTTGTIAFRQSALRMACPGVDLAAEMSGDRRKVPHQSIERRRNGADLDGVRFRRPANAARYTADHGVILSVLRLPSESASKNAFGAYGPTPSIALTWLLITLELVNVPVAPWRYSPPAKAAEFALKED